jgi:hypothetical protein
MGIIDLSWVKENSENSGRYLCGYCIPDVEMIEVTDPKLIEFLEPGKHRLIQRTQLLEQMKRLRH